MFTKLFDNITPHFPPYHNSLIYYSNILIIIIQDASS